MWVIATNVVNWLTGLATDFKPLTSHSQGANSNGLNGFRQFSPIENLNLFINEALFVRFSFGLEHDLSSNSNDHALEFKAWMKFWQMLWKF